MKEKLFLCFWVGNGLDRESYSVYYSALVEAVSKQEAINKHIDSLNEAAEKNPKYYNAIEMTILK